MEPKIKRILIFSTLYFPFVGGAELALKEITERIKDAEFHLITAKFKKDLPSFEKVGNINVYRIGWGSKIDKILLPILGFKFAIKLKKYKKFNLIFGLMASYGSVAAYFFKILNPQIPFLLNLQEGSLNRNSSLDRFFQKRIIKKADVITVISKYLADFAKRFNKKAPLHVIPNGVDIEKFSQTFSYGELLELKDKLNIKPDEKIIITISRLVYKNNIANLIRAFKKIQEKHQVQSLKLLIIGAGPLKKELERITDELGISGKVIFCGEVANDDLPKYLAISSVFCRPSLSEGLGTAFLEAMASGVPIVGTNVGGIPDFLVDKETGLFCDPNNIDDMADKIFFLINEEKLRKKIIKNSFKLIKEKYNWDLIAKEYEKIINNYSGI